MTPLTALLICLAGGLGAGLRFTVDHTVTRLIGHDFPWGIVLVNITGSFALGVVAVAVPDSMSVIGIGLLGGYTTFSTAMLDAIGTREKGTRSSVIGHVLITFGGCVLGALGGIALGGIL